MSTPPPPPPPERFAALITCVAAAVAKRTGWALTLQLIALIATRLRTIKWRFLRLAARIAAGTYRPRPRSAAPREEAAERPRRAPPKDPLPRTFGWLRPLIEETPQFAGWLDNLLHDPEMAALMAAAPGPMGRVLRPLCKMFGVRPPPVIALPPRRKRPPRPPPKPEPKWPHDPRRRDRFGFYKGPPPPFPASPLRRPPRKISG